MKYLGPPQSGSLANNVASRNTYGQYYRDRVMPDETSTTARASVRARWATVSDLWGTASDGTRAEWIAWADGFPRPDSLGKKRPLSGRAMWMLVGMQSFEFTSLFDLTHPPAFPEWTGRTPVVAQNLTLGHTVGWTVTVDPAPTPHAWCVDLCGPLGSGVMSLPGRGYWKRSAYVFTGSSSVTVLRVTLPGQVWGLRVREFSGATNAAPRIGLVSAGFVFRQVAV